MSKTILTISIAVLLMLAACSNQENGKGNFAEIEQLTKENQDLKNQLENKDNEVNAFVQSFSDIEENLQAVMEREKILKGNTANVELRKSKQDLIADDINAISELIGKNKEQLAQLKRKLKNANGKVAELLKVVASLEAKILEKDEEIALLKEELERSNSSYKDLFVEYQAKVEEVEVTKQELEQTTAKLNKAYYAFGTAKELKEKGVITKDGGFIGLGKIEKLKDDFNKDYFTTVDIQNTPSITLKCKTAKILTNHPKSSYKLEMAGKTVDKLIILNSEDFWSVSKYLVVVVD